MSGATQDKADSRSTLHCAYLLLLGATLSGCASNPGSVVDDVAVFSEVTAEGPAAHSGQARQRKGVRRAAGASQAVVLYARSVYIDPISRPVSNATSLASWVLKSTVGFFRRIGLTAVREPLLDRIPMAGIAHGDGMDLAQWERDLDEIVGRESSTGKIDFLIDGDQYFTRLLESFDGAQESIDIRTYIFDSDDYAVAVADVLKEKAERVRVRIQIDALGNLMAMQADPASLPSDHTSPLSISQYLRKNSAVKIRNRANPYMYIGDHTKTTIIDGRTAFVGGMNIGREYRHEWHDLMMEVSGPIVDQLQHDSNKAWARASVLGDVANFVVILRGKKSRAGDEGYPVRALYTRNFDSEIYRAQVEAIRRSQRYILIENSYFSDDLITHELARARRRGVDVRVLLPRDGNHQSLHASNQVAINTLLDNGIRVYIYPGMSHVKAAIFDGWACVGSANFDKLSLEVNKELNLATSDSATVGKLLEQVFIPDLAISREVTERVEVTFAQVLAERAVDEFL
jgi:cardiolipin synthase A/B